MRFYTLCLIAICYLAVIAKSIKSDTPYYVYDKSTKKCLGRYLTSNGYTEYYTLGVKAKCTKENRWYIEDEGEYYNFRPYYDTSLCIATYNWNQLGLNTCGKSRPDVWVVDGVVIKGNSICSKLGSGSICFGNNLVISESKP